LLDTDRRRRWRPWSSSARHGDAAGSWEVFAPPARTIGRRRWSCCSTWSHAGARERLGVFYALPLFGGVALYLAGQLLFKRRMHHVLSLPRLLATGVLLAALPAAVVLPPLVGLAGLVLILAALIVVETTRYAQIRRSLRGAESSAAVDAK
jgi:hypothetical protein